MPRTKEGGTHIREQNILAREPQAPEYARLLHEYGDIPGAAGFWDALRVVKRLELALAERPE